MNRKVYVWINMSLAGILWASAVTIPALAADRIAAADNTAVNADDRSLATPVDQSNDADAIKVTANIRKAVLGDQTLSTSAHNVKIITSGNTVTLRGPVASAEEKERVTSLARQHAHGKDILDQLTVNGA
jgi:osmotically-inducible protein OsmY